MTPQTLRLISYHSSLILPLKKNEKDSSTSVGMTLEMSNVYESWYNIACLLALYVTPQALRLIPSIHMAVMDGSIFNEPQNPENLQNLLYPFIKTLGAGSTKFAGYVHGEVCR